jgi:phosphatidylglycerophosphatase A
MKNVATLGFIGYMPAAPGTWGSLTAVLFIALLGLSPRTELLLIAAGIVIGSIVAHTAESVIGEVDSGHIIIDEFIGMMVSVVYLPHTFGYLISAFLLFRFFDILKPFPIKYAESSLRGGVGIMADDVLAGIMANGILQIWTIYSG